MHKPGAGLAAAGLPPAVRHFVVLRRNILIGHGILWSDGNLDGYTEVLLLGVGRWHKSIREETFPAAMAATEAQCGLVSVRWLDD